MHSDAVTQVLHANILQSVRHSRLIGHPDHTPAHEQRDQHAACATLWLTSIWNLGMTLHEFIVLSKTLQIIQVHTHIQVHTYMSGTTYVVYDTCNMCEPYAMFM